MAKDTNEAGSAMRKWRRITRAHAAMMTRKYLYGLSKDEEGDLAGMERQLGEASDAYLAAQSSDAVRQP